MNYVKYKNQIFRKKRYCEKSKKIFYLKKISKIKIKKYFYIYLDKKRINFDHAISLVPEANPEEIGEINKLKNDAKL
jgi:hypothetical protein